MTLAPLVMYDDALAAATCGAAGGLSLRYADGRLRPLNVGRWCGPLDAGDRSLLDRCEDPTLDVGCGPGRLVAALTAGGTVALGVDVAERAVHLTRVAGAAAVRRSVFEPLPSEGGWRSVLLADGNIGIGGHPVRLLARCRSLLARHGRVLVEVDPPATPSSSVTVRLETPADSSEWFPWAHVAADDVDGPAAAAGLRVTERWTVEGRWFASLAG